MQDLPAKIQRARAATEASTIPTDERDYLASGVRLGRLATVGPDAMPHVVPTAFRYNQDHDTIDGGGHDFTKRKKYRDVLRNPRSPSSLGRGFAPEMFRITPQRIVSWGTERTDVVQREIRP